MNKTNWHVIIDPIVVLGKGHDETEGARYQSRLYRAQPARPLIGFVRRLHLGLALDSFITKDRYAAELVESEKSCTTFLVLPGFAGFFLVGHCSRPTLDGSDVGGAHYASPRNSIHLP